ncbi:hypothetical protein VPH35_052282 [Triticum aestivum]
MWSGETRPECFRYRVLGLPRGKLDAVSRIRRSAALFLYDFHAKYLYGPYRAKTVRALLAGLGKDNTRGLPRRHPRYNPWIPSLCNCACSRSFPVRSADLAPLHCLESSSTRATLFAKCQYLRNLTRTRFWWFSFHMTF